MGRLHTARLMREYWSDMPMPELVRALVGECPVAASRMSPFGFRAS
jgi:hypothetical protein